MLASYNRLAAMLRENGLPTHKQQILEASLVMLKDMMADKTRDIRRRLRESREY